MLRLMKVKSNGILSAPVVLEDKTLIKWNLVSVSGTYPNTGVSEEILIECTETRDQPKNKERALTRLRSFIYDKEHQKYLDDIAAKRKTMVSTGDRSAKIRTYNYPQGRITDHRINYTIYNLSAFMDGDIQDCIDHLIIAENAERMKESEL